MKARATPPPSDLGILAEAELRLDRALAEARATAAARISSARARIDTAAAAFEAELATERGRIARDVAAATERAIATLVEDARTQVARYGAVADDAATRLAVRLGEILTSIVRAEAAP